MRIAMIGSGYVGLVSGACFSEFGINVVCVDKDEKKIKDLENGIIPIYEPGLDKLVKDNYEAKRLSFSTNLKEAVKDVDAIFIAVGTPTRRGDGHADLSYVYKASEEIAEAIEGYTVIVNKSTVPVGTGKEVEEIIKKTNPNADFDVVSNPEFLREGSAIGDFMRPDRVVIGTESDRAKDVMRKLYRVLYLIETPIVFTSRETSELIKYASNAFLAMKISYINEIADLCEKVNANVHDVAKGMGLDGRIGNKFLHPGPGYGGSCFPKDTLALVKTAEQYESPISLIEATININDNRKVAMAEKIIKACQGDVKGKNIAILGLTFKPNTDDMRDSASLVIVPKLVEQGANVSVFDPQGMEEAKKQISGVKWCESSYETMENADALVILTEWNEFRTLQIEEVKKQMKGNVVVDLRNIFDTKDMRDEGFEYVSIGRPISRR